MTICITSYNLEKYIGEALESILKQHTEFPYKILVADDCSTDRTLEILEQYRKEYPDIIEIRAASANMGSLANSNRIFDGLQSEYFTLLDGDDYWIDDKHLQKQVDFLDSHTEYQMCAGNTQMMRDGKLAEYFLAPDDLERMYTFDDMLCDHMRLFIPRQFFYEIQSFVRVYLTASKRQWENIMNVHCVGRIFEE